jgi:phosphoribosylformylglycinamidine cyclo-ligase
MGLIADAPLKDLTYLVNGKAMQVHTQLGRGLKEAVYQNALADKLRETGLTVEVEKRVEVYVGDSLVGLLFIDLLVENKLIVECKAFSHLTTDEDVAQVITYLAATGQPVGLLLNFGRGRLEHRRILPPEHIQEWHKHIRRYIWTPPDSQAIRLDIPDHVAVRPVVTDQLTHIQLAAEPSKPPRPRAPTPAPSPAPTAASASAYAAAGVDIDRKMGAIDRFKEVARKATTPAVLAGIGNFGGLYDAAQLKAAAAPVLVASTDGVGTKTKIASALGSGSYKGLGYDIVNHCINDILVQGARPLFFLDYIASSRLNPERLVELVDGCAEACAAAGCALLGGETAEMPGVYAPGEFDLVGTIVGWLDREALVDGRDVRPGDVCLGLPSSGLHTNGYSLARHVFADTPWDTPVEELGKTLGETLLVFHRSYLQSVEKLWKLGINVKAMAHITGGGYPDNLPRVMPEGTGVALDRCAWEPLPIFQLIQERGEVDPLEMYRVFNMGMGMVLYLAPEDVDPALRALEDAFPEGPPVPIGEVTAWDGTGEQIVL